METLEDQEMKENVEVMRNLQEVILELKVHSVRLLPLIGRMDGDERHHCSVKPCLMLILLICIFQQPALFICVL